MTTAQQHARAAVIAAWRWLGLDVSSATDRGTAKAFRHLAVAQALSAAGDAIVTVALAGSVFFSTSVTAARGRVALSLVLTLAPFAVIAPFLGPAIDRSSGGRRFMVIGSAAGRALACWFMAGTTDNLLLFLPWALVVLILSKAQAVAKSSLVPSTVTGSETLVRANGRLAVLAAGSGLVAGGIGAAVLQLVGASWSLRLATVVYVTGAVAGFLLRPAPRRPVESAAHRERAIRARGVAWAFAAMTALRATVGFLTFAVAFDFRRTHASTLWYGVVAVGGVAGGFFGNMLGPAIRRLAVEERMVAASLTFVALGGLAAWWLDRRVAIALLAFTVGLAGGVGRLAFDAIVQRDSEERSRSRSFARFEAAFQLAWVVCALIPTIVPGGGIPGRIAALMIAVFTGASALAYVLGRRTRPRSARGAPSPPAPPEAAREMPRPAGPRRNPLRASGVHPDGGADGHRAG